MPEPTLTRIFALAEDLQDSPDETAQALVALVGFFKNPDSRTLRSPYHVVMEEIGDLESMRSAAIGEMTLCQADLARDTDFVPKYTKADMNRAVVKTLQAILDGETTFSRSIEVFNCARCGRTHKVAFRPFAGSPVDGEWAYWGICINTGDPILMQTEG